MIELTGGFANHAVVSGHKRPMSAAAYTMNGR